MPPLKPGDKAPDFTLLDQNGEKFSLQKSLEERKAWHLIYFYPKADTPGCTTQACGIRDHQADYDVAGAVVLGVSPDEPKALRKFADKFGLPFTLLGDADHQVAEAYGVWVEKSMYGKKYMGFERTTFVIGPDQTIQRVLRKVKPAEHDDLVLGALSAAR